VAMAIVGVLRKDSEVLKFSDTKVLTTIVKKIQFIKKQKASQGFNFCELSAFLYNLCGIKTISLLPTLRKIAKGIIP
jgi:hypothetical protein